MCYKCCYPIAALALALCLSSCSDPEAPVADSDVSSTAAEQTPAPVREPVPVVAAEGAFDDPVFCLAAVPALGAQFVVRVG